MSDSKVENDEFIPFNQSTPVQGGWQRRNQNQGFQNRFHSGHKRNSGGYNNRWNNSRGNSSFESDRSNGSQRQSFNDNISAYLHPSMLQDPWAQLRQQRNDSHLT